MAHAPDWSSHHARSYSTASHHPHWAALMKQIRNALHRHRKLAEHHAERQQAPALHCLRAATQNAMLLAHEVRHAHLPPNQEIALLTETLDLLTTIVDTVQAACNAETQTQTITGQPMALLAMAMMSQEHVARRLEDLEALDDAYVVIHPDKLPKGLIGKDIEAVLAEFSGVEFGFDEEDSLAEEQARASARRKLSA